MGISVMTALVIQSRGDDIHCEAEGPCCAVGDEAHGKWVGWINLYRDGEFDHPLLDSGPRFNTADEAIDAMKKLVAEIRQMKIENPLDSMPGEVRGAIAAIVEGARRG